MKRFDTGLVVGKFCPLHRGHQLLLDQARLQCDRLVVISYTRPEFAGCAPELRERWLATLYPDAVRFVLDDERLAEHCLRLGIAHTRLPHNDASDDVHRRFVAWLLEVLLRVQVDAVFTSEAYGEGFAAALTTLQHARSGPPVVHVSVDPGRGGVPVSGNAVRANVHGLRHLLDPVVYRDFVRRVAILGGESTGKSMLAAQLADRLTTVHAAEYGRELWEQKNGVLTKADMLCIARAQVQREEDCALEANQWVICDTTPLTTMLYSHAMFGGVEGKLELLARRPYDVVFLCVPDVPFVQDGTRRNELFRRWQHEWYLRELNARGVRYQLLQGSWQARITTAAEHLKLAGG